MRKLILGLVIGFVAVVQTLSAAVAQTRDVRTYCARAGDDDLLRPLQPDLVAVARRLFDLGPDMTKDLVLASTSMRCMNGAAWLCNYGANLACGKANVSRKSPGATAFCKQHPDSIGVPMSATGHDTIFSWKCVGAEARIDQQFEQVDARGFLADNWKRLP